MTSGGGLQGRRSAFVNCFSVEEKRNSTLSAINLGARIECGVAVPPVGLEPLFEQT